MTNKQGTSAADEGVDSRDAPDAHASTALARRRFLQISAGLVGAAAPGAAVLSKPAGSFDPHSSGEEHDEAARRRRGPDEFVIRGGHVLTMDAQLGDKAVADVHVRDGMIVAIGKDLRAARGRTIDARDTIVMPGFVDTHSHLWSSLLRGSIRGDDPVHGYFPVTNRAAPLMTIEDTYNSVRFGVVQQLMSGITSVNNYSHNTRSPEHADAEIRAMLDTGIRGRFSYGPAGRGGSINLADVARVQNQWLPGNPLLSLGVNLNNPPPQGPIDTFAAEVAEARRLGVPISLHFANPAPGLYAEVQRRGLFGPDVLVIHAQGFDAAERQILVDSKVKLSMSPVIEINYSTVRDGYVQFDELEQMGAQLSLSLDASAASATADFFNVMRVLQFTHRQRADTKIKLLPRRVVELATIDGARALGLDSKLGSLTPGKRADIILVRKTDANITPVLDPYYSLVYSGMPENVDTVIVDGNILRHRGKFTSLNVDRILQKAVASAVRLDAEMKKVLNP